MTWRARILSLGVACLLGSSVGLAPAAGTATLPSARCRAWKIIPSPIVVGGGLAGVSGTSASDVWAVGSSVDTFDGLIMHWDGTAWTLTDEIPRTPLQDVVAITSTDAWAIVGGGLAEHWDGNAWTPVNIPSPGVQSSLFKLSASSSSDVWAGGYYSGNDGKLHPLTIHYDGTSWKAIKAPDGSPTGTNVFRGITAVGPNDAWGVGYQDVGGLNLQPLAEHWDGTSWTVVPAAPPPSGTVDEFWSVAGSSSDDVWAVGIYNAAVATPLVEHWDGTSWTLVTLPGLTNSNELFDVATDGPNDVWAVGESFNLNPPKPWAEHWDGTTWKAQASPNPGNAYLYGVEILSATNIWAVGSDFDEGLNDHVPLIEQSKGAC